jgi:hypothetical protein
MTESNHEAGVIVAITGLLDDRRIGTAFVDGIALLVDGSIEISPLTSDFNIRFIQPSARWQ